MSRRDRCDCSFMPDLKGLQGRGSADVRLCPRFQQVLYQQIHEEFGKPDLAPEEHDILRNMEPSEIDAMADELYARDDLLGRYIRWSLLYTRYRYELAEELDQLHGKIGQKSRVMLMTPAIVDFSKWLEDDHHSSIGDQVQVMGAARSPQARSASAWFRRFLSAATGALQRPSAPSGRQGSIGARPSGHRGRWSGE
jgi:hypothetical protein